VKCKKKKRKEALPSWRIFFGHPCLSCLHIKACPHCRRKMLQFVAEKWDCRRKLRFRRCLAVFGDSRTFL